MPSLIRLPYTVLQLLTPLMTAEMMSSLTPKPLMETVLPQASTMTSLSPVATSFGNAVKGSVLSY